MNVLVIQWEPKEFGRKICKRGQPWRRQESYRKWTFSAHRLCKKSSKQILRSITSVLPNSSIFTGSKTCPNLTKRKCEIKIAILFWFSNPFIPIIPLSFHSAYSVIFLHLWQSQEELGSSLETSTRENQCLVSQSVQRCEWHWAIWLVCRRVSTDWVFWKSLCSRGCKHPLQSVSLLNNLKDAGLLAHLPTALHTLSTADPTIAPAEPLSSHMYTSVALTDHKEELKTHIPKGKRNEICFAVKKPDIYTAVNSGEQHL